MATYDYHYVHSFTSMQDLPFSAPDYSKLKFGSDAAARKFGYELADTFFAQQAPVLLSNQVVVLPSPYNFVPNAASVMTTHFVNRLNQLLVEANGTHVETSIINRKVTYTSDYGFMSKEKRAELISNDKFNVNKGYLEGKVLICIDDIRITGVHEDKLKEIFNGEEMDNHVFFLYYASYVGQKADIEAELNFSGIRNIKEYLELTKERNHHLIVRPIKFLLSQDAEEFDSILCKADEDFIEKLYYACLGEGYYMIPQYQQNFGIIQEFSLNNRKE